MNKLFGLSLIGLAIATAACSDHNEVTTVKIKQYADEVIDFSEEYTDDPGWTASELLGAPDVYPSYGDSEGAWTTASKLAGRQFLILGFDTVQTVSKIEVFETDTPGSIDTVYLRNSSTKQWNKVYTGTAAYIETQEANVFTVNLSAETTYKVDAIRLALNTDIYDDWIEIDAVAISGNRKK